MPTYVYACAQCERETEEFRQIDQRHDGPMCHGKAMHIVIAPAYAQADLPGYVSPATGKWVEGRAARRDDLARSGCRPWEGQEAETKEAQKRRAESEAKFDRKLDDGIRRIYHQLPPSKRRELEGR